MKNQGKETRPRCLSLWDWYTLVASWRYYQYGHTITSASFPSEIVERFWSASGVKKWNDNSRREIANQFAKIDHGLAGASDWDNSTGGIAHDEDRYAWVTFYNFCLAWCDGFSVIEARHDNGELEKVACFKSDGKWIPRDAYLSNPYPKVSINDELITSVTNTVVKEFEKCE